MILAAERLFAQRGIANVSLPEIRAAANNRNTAAVRYHFGSKQGLIKAILEYRAPHINELRQAILADIEREGRADDLRSLADAAIRPLADTLQAGSCYARFVAQVLADPAYRPMLRIDVRYREGMMRTRAQLGKLLRGLPAAIRAERLSVADRMWIQALAEHERRLEARTAPAIPTAASLANLADMMVAMLSAPVSGVTCSLMQGAAAGAARTRTMGSRGRKTAPKAKTKRLKKAD